MKLDETTKNTSDNVINTNNIYKIFKSTTIEAGLKYIKSKLCNWGLKTQILKLKVGTSSSL